MAFAAKRMQPQPPRPGLPRHEPSRKYRHISHSFSFWVQNRAAGRKGKNPPARTRHRPIQTSLKGKGKGSGEEETLRGSPFLRTFPSPSHVIQTYRYLPKLMQEAFRRIGGVEDDDALGVVGGPELESFPDAGVERHLLGFETPLFSGEAQAPRCGGVHVSAHRSSTKGRARGRHSPSLSERTKDRPRWSPLSSAPPPRRVSGRDVLRPIREERNSSSGRFPRIQEGGAFGAAERYNRHWKHRPENGRAAVPTVE